MKWIWPGSTQIDSAMQALQRYLSDEDKYIGPQAVIRTTDATVTTLYTAKIPVDTTTLVSGLVVARRTGGAAGSANDGAGYTVQFVAKNTSGTAALIGAGTVTTLGESQAGWDCTLSASGDGIRVRVTGAANNNVVWKWAGKSMQVKE